MSYHEMLSKEIENRIKRLEILMEAQRAMIADVERVKGEIYAMEQEMTNLTEVSHAS